MTIVAFDTETTGLPKFQSRSDDPAQPHLVQLAMVTFSDDGRERNSKSIIVRPDGWTIPPEAFAIHGISHERAMDEGVREGDAVADFLATMRRADLRVAHNCSFDDKIMRIAMIRSGLTRDFIEWMQARKSFDTCSAAKPIINLPPTEAMTKRGMTQAKPPKLVECVRHFFGEDLLGAHDALIDARACGRVYFHLTSLRRA